KTLASSNGREVRLWDIATGKETTPVLGGHRGSVEAFVFLPDGKGIATVGDDQTVRLWEIASGKELRSAHWPDYTTYPTYSLSPDGRWLAFRGDRKAVFLCDVTAGRELRRLPLQASCFAFTPDSQTLVMGAGDDIPIRFWDLTTNKQRHGLAHERSYDYSLAM